MQHSPPPYLPALVAFEADAAEVDHGGRDRQTRLQLRDLVVGAPGDQREDKHAVS